MCGTRQIGKTRWGGVPSPSVPLGSLVLCGVFARPSPARVEERKRLSVPLGSARGWRWRPGVGHRRNAEPPGRCAGPALGGGRRRSVTPPVAPPTLFLSFPLCSVLVHSSNLPPGDADLTSAPSPVTLGVDVSHLHHTARICHLFLSASVGSRGTFLNEPGFVRTSATFYPTQITHLLETPCVCTRNGNRERGIWSRRSVCECA